MRTNQSSHAQVFYKQLFCACVNILESNLHLNLIHTIVYILLGISPASNTI